MMIIYSNYLVKVHQILRCVISFPKPSTLLPLFHDSHKKQKDSLETWAVHIKICMLYWNLTSGPKHRGSFYDNIPCAKGDQPLGGDLHSVLDKIEPDVLQIRKKWNRKWIRILQQKRSSCKFQFCIKVSESPRLVP